MQESSRQEKPWFPVDVSLNQPIIERHRWLNKFHEIPSSQAKPPDITSQFWGKFRETLSFVDEFQKNQICSKRGRWLASKQARSPQDPLKSWAKNGMETHPKSRGSEFPSTV